MNTTTSFISTIFTAACVAGNTFDKGILMFDALLSAIPQDRLESVLKEVIDLSDINIDELKSQVDNLTLETVFPCSTTIANGDIVVNELVKDIHNNNIPFAGVKSFLLTVEEHITAKFIARTDITALSNFMLSIADFGESNTVSQTSSLLSETSTDKLRSDQTLSWDNNSGAENCEDIGGLFTVHLNHDGLCCTASAGGDEISIVNYDEVIALTANKFRIPKSLLSKD